MMPGAGALPGRGKGAAPVVLVLESLLFGSYEHCLVLMGTAVGGKRLMSLVPHILLKVLELANVPAQSL
jgi:hypothetical protein